MMNVPRLCDFRSVWSNLIILTVSVLGGNNVAPPGAPQCHHIEEPFFEVDDSFYSV